ncbi:MULTISPECIES: signal peptide peptidase SppA [unclassified Halomonas]|uniref:signal peptide peptidase SppA n=1 Tax=unclassified Halomonas TaxID=2609666 RepID=UPI0006DB16DE|nr:MULTISPECIES: signal peptide peptidase SppA [unclassified Halomonas]KPQ20121.1 MAG: signal peptide peptidase SppA [Halomonas sp. HL-93]SBR49531.1 protease-4 [Halomonas sp. HL-93]SNY96417.1 protease-4 [Halomonas sp. hl-4]
MKDDDSRSDASQDTSSPTGHQDAEDRWTQGPEVPPKGSSDVGQPSDDAATLRERQRLAQIEMMDHWIGGVLAEQRRSRRWKLFFRLLMLSLLAVALGLGFYQFYAPSTGAPTDQAHLARVDVNGVIAEDAPANAERIIEGLRNAWEADSAEAIVLHINSPGGSPVQSQRIFAEIMRLRESGDKPIVAVIEDIGASGAYYIAAAADDIVASPVSLVGSIGVIYAGFGLEEAIDRVGVERRVLTAGDNKAFLDPFQPFDDDDEAFWQSVLNSTHQQFIDDVKAGRGDRLSDSDDLFSGLVWSGEQAKALGLVDQLGSMDDVARQYADEAEWQNYTPSLDPFDRITRRFTQTAAQLLGVDTSPSPLRFQAP